MLASRIVTYGLLDRAPSREARRAWSKPRSTRYAVCLVGGPAAVAEFGYAGDLKGSFVAV
jgi:hypothetical protein